MTRAASVTSTWRSSQRSVSAARFHSCAAETRCLSDVAARQNGAARLEKRSVEAQQRPLSRLVRAGFGGARRVRRAKTQGAMELPSRRSAAGRVNFVTMSQNVVPVCHNPPSVQRRTTPKGTPLLLNDNLHKDMGL